ncbi:MAG TPA: hypothetical protein VM935_11420 [Chitinophagaceae bacterium]|nr:hypothetical protein [Chitinophagaceae bacterium]
MKIHLTLWQKILVVTAFFALASVGFMIKLPSGFRHIDKGLHATFYFLSAALFNVLFAKTKIVRHVIIFTLLYMFGMIIEFGQAYSNRFFRTRIHGRFDPQDLQANLNGLLAFSLLWLLWMIAKTLYKKTAPERSTIIQK